MARVHAHARSDVVSSRWDKDKNIGLMTFRCQSCAHEWEEKMVFSNGPLKGKPYNRGAWSFLARYWRAGAGGVKTKCPSCGAGGGR